MFLTNNTCEGIGDCIKECPTKAIRFVDGRAFSCITCGVCMENCPNNAISKNKYEGYVIDRAKCNGCGICKFNCPTNNINIVDGIVYGICARCGSCAEACPNNSRVDGYAQVKDKQLDFINSLYFTLTDYEFPEKSEKKIVERTSYVTDTDKCIMCGRCDVKCPTGAIDVHFDQEDGICTECRSCEDVCPTDSIKKFNVDHETCTLCFNCVKSCPRNAIMMDDFKIYINKFDLETNGSIVSCLNCGLCADILDGDALKFENNNLRYDPIKDIISGCRNHLEAINACPAGVLKETNEIIVESDEDNIDILTGYCVSCGLCAKVCNVAEARSLKTFTWDGSVSEDCISCGICFEVCPKEAITLSRGKIQVNLDKCILCENCAIHCPKDAIPKTSMAKKVIDDGFNQIDPILCASCGLCYKICPEEAIVKVDDGYEVNEDKCTYCGACKNACPFNAFMFERIFRNSVEGI